MVLNNPETDAEDAKLAVAADASLAAKLSPSELIFCDLISRGLNLNSAFAKACPQSLSVRRNNSQAISVSAGRMVRRPHVKAYLGQLRQPSVFTTFLTRDHKRAKLAEIVATCSDVGIVLRAIDLDNDMSGDRAPKTSVSLSPSLAVADRLLAWMAARPDVSGGVGVQARLQAGVQAQFQPPSSPPQSQPEKRVGPDVEVVSVSSRPANWQGQWQEPANGQGGAGSQPQLAAGGSQAETEHAQRAITQPTQPPHPQ